MVRLNSLLAGIEVDDEFHFNETLRPQYDLWFWGWGGISTIAEQLVAVVREDPVPFEIDY